jgi:DNA-binding transcriptional ArsR family regulator
MIERFRATAPPQAPVGIEIAVRPAAELLIGLYALTVSEPRPSEESWVPALTDCSPQLRRLVKRIGTDSGELWLHLLGLALDLPTTSASTFIGRLAEVEALELRRHLVGAYCPAWIAAVGGDVLERAAAGERGAAAVLLADDCYYGGHAATALAQILPLSASKTKQLVIATIEQFQEEIFRERDEALLARLRAGGLAHQAQIDTARLEHTVALVTGGYTYRPEPDVARIVLVPHLAAPPWILLCQHRDARLICYPAEQVSTDPEKDLRNRLLRLGRTLSDEKRVEIIRHLAAGPATLNELTAVTALSKSTVHHHMAQIRAAGLIAVHGNARNFSYSLSDEGMSLSLSLLSAGFGLDSGLNGPTRPAR